MSPPASGDMKATVRASSQIRLEDGSPGKGLVYEADRGTAYVAITPDGPVPFGELVFRGNDQIVENNGVHTFADIHWGDGALAPVSIRIRQSRTQGK